MKTVISGKTVLITGGARGIGKALATRLVDEGMQVVITDLDIQTCQQTAKSLGRPGRPVHAYQQDVTDADQFHKLVAQIVQDVAPIDVIINNAGVMSLGPFLDQPTDCDQQQIDVNLHGVINGMRAAMPGMVRRGNGHVINIASSAGKVGIPYAATYSATKFAVVGLSEAVRHEMEGTGVDVSYIMPSLVKTELIAGAGRMKYPPPAAPEDVADAVVKALKTKRVGLFVPRFARLGAVLPAVLPRRVYERLGRMFGVNDMFRDLDDDARAKYRGRSDVR